MELAELFNKCAEIKGFPRVKIDKVVKSANFIENKL